MSSSFSDMKSWSVLLVIIIYINMISAKNVPSFFSSWVFRTAILILLFALLCYDTTTGILFAVATTVSLVYSEIHHTSKLVESYVDNTHVDANGLIIENPELEAKENFTHFTPLEEEHMYSSHEHIFPRPHLNSDAFLKTASNDFLVAK